MKATIQREEYNFLRTNKHLGSNILFLTLGGSHAYGTNVEGSDIDIRGVAGSPEILGFNHFEQAIDNQTDTVIYAVNKFVSLLVQGNPNIIELLGNDPELYVNMTPEGQMLLDNKELFLTRRIAYSYGGFANDQLRRLQMGLLRNGTSPEAFKNKFEKRSLERSIAGWGKDDIFEISISEDADEEGKHPLLISGNLNDYPVTSLKSLLKSLTTTIDQYEQPQHPKAQKMLPTSTNTRCTLCGCTTPRSISWKRAKSSLAGTKSEKSCWRFATASTCVKTGRMHRNSSSLLMRLKRDFRMMQGRLHFLRNLTLEKLRSFWWKSTRNICGASCN